MTPMGTSFEKSTHSLTASATMLLPFFLRGNVGAFVGVTVLSEK